VKYFPESRYAVNALFIKARALDTKIDAGEFRRTKWVRFYDDFPDSASRPTWRKIAEARPDTLLGAVASLRLAQLDARNGLVERAIDRLETLLRGLGAVSEAEASQNNTGSALTDLWQRNAPESSLGISRERVLLEADRMRNLLVANRDPLYGYEPIHGPRRPAAGPSFGLLDLDPRAERYAEKLQRLKDAYPNCQIEDNIDLEIAKTTEPLTDQIAALRRCLEIFPDRDAVPEALFRLGVAYKVAGQTRNSETTFIRLFNECPDSVWTAQAAHYTTGRAVVAGTPRATKAPRGTSGS
jgi:hypothetical protein